MLPVIVVPVSIPIQVVFARTAYLRHGKQVALEQDRMEEQALPQLPQLLWLECGSTQPPLQQRFPVAHLVHNGPQLFGSVLVFTHVVPHKLGVAVGQQVLVL